MNIAAANYREADRLGRPVAVYSGIAANPLKALAWHLHRLGFSSRSELLSLVQISPLGGVTVVSIDLGVMAIAVGIDGVVCSALSVDGLIWSPLVPLP